MDLVTFALFVLLTIFIWLWKWENSDFVKKIDAIPGQKKIPFLGNMIQAPHDGYGTNSRYEKSIIRRCFLIFMS